MEDNISCNDIAEIYDNFSYKGKSVGNSSHDGWIIIPDTKSSRIIPYAYGAAGDENGESSDWKIHISIDPEKIREAALIICEELNRVDAPRISIKFASAITAKTGQPSKQAAFCFYRDELNNPDNIRVFLENLNQRLNAAQIGVDSRVINSDEEAAKTKYDASILDSNNNPTRFNYRNDAQIVMVDDDYFDLGGKGDFQQVGQTYWVSQGYYKRLPNSKKHNPVGCKDPFEKMRLSPLFDQSDREPNIMTHSTVPAGFQLKCMSIIKSPLFKVACLVILASVIEIGIFLSVGTTPNVAITTSAILTGASVFSLAVSFFAKKAPSFIIANSQRDEFLDHPMA